jgi:hypothetical protein
MNKFYPMKIVSISSLVLLIILFTGCNSKRSKNINSKIENDTVTVADTGFTGITKYYNGKMIMKEVTFKNGVQQGLTKTFYPDGKLYQTIWYEKGVREDTSRWYYKDGKVFRASPYKNDTINGTQLQYYRSGRVKAKMSYISGIRTPYLEEFTMDGKLVKGYPELIIKAKDEYKDRGVYTLTLELSNKSDKVKYYKGGYIDGLFDPAKYPVIKTAEGKGYLVLNKTGTAKAPYVEVIAEVPTDFGNYCLINKKIDLPYNDLK